MARLCVANICIPKLLLQSNWTTGSLLLMVCGAQVFPWKGSRSIPVTGKWKCRSCMGDREPHPCLHGGAVVSVTDWAGLSARWWAVFRSTCQAVWGESPVLAEGVGQSLSWEDVRKFGRGMLQGQGEVTEDFEELGLWGDRAWNPAWPES